MPSQAINHPIEGSKTMCLRHDFYEQSCVVRQVNRFVRQINLKAVWLRTSREKNDSRMIGVSLAYRFNRGKEIKKSQNDNRIEENKRIGL
jgi:hypothetical protein